MVNIKIRTLYPWEIEFKTLQVSTDKNGNPKGVVATLYKNARVDMEILDETFGTLGWKNIHEMIDGRMFCTIYLWDSEKNEWVTKSNVGSLDSNNGAGGSTKVKGEISDSFKRAATVVGIGRELYSSPFIWIPADRLEFKQTKNGYSVNTPLHVSLIEYDEQRRISKLEIVKDRDGTPVYRYARPASQRVQQNAQQHPQAQQNAPSNEAPQAQANAQQQKPTAQAPAQNQATNQAPAQKPANQQTQPKQNNQQANKQNSQNAAQPAQNAPANGAISVTPVTAEAKVAPGDVVIPVGFAKGQTLSQYYQNQAARLSKDGKEPTPETIFKFYLELNRPEYESFKASCVAFMNTLKAA